MLFFSRKSVAFLSQNKTNRRINTQNRHLRHKHLQLIEKGPTFVYRLFSKKAPHPREACGAFAFKSYLIMREVYITFFPMLIKVERIGKHFNQYLQSFQTLYG